MRNGEGLVTLLVAGLVIVGSIFCAILWQLYQVLTWEHVSFSVNILKLAFEGIFWVALIGGIIGLAAHFLPIRQNITILEFLTWIAIFSIVVAPLATFIGWNKANQERLKRNEFWHGWEVSTKLDVIDCTRDGPCIHEYQCDSYRCNPHDCNCTCTSRDSNGNCTSESCDTCYDTCYHDCPYCTQEIVTTVNTTIQPFVIDNHVFTESPKEWRPGGGIPGNVQRGPSQFWKDAKIRVDKNDPGPVTVVKQYENPLLASDLTILKNYSAQIEEFQKKGLIPSPVNQIHSYYLVDNVEFVGIKVADEGLWNRAVDRLNAPFGDELQGDFRLVVVNSEYAEQNKTAYLYALKFNWQDEIKYGDDLASKNTFILVLFTKDGKTISSAGAITGMPLGNEYLLERVNSVLSGKPLDPVALFGRVSGEIYLKTYPPEQNKPAKLAVKPLHKNPGLVEDLLWGISDPQSKFVRVSMSKNFAYLWKEVVPKQEAQDSLRFWTIVLGIIGWVIAVGVGEKDVFKHRTRWS